MKRTSIPSPAAPATSVLIPSPNREKLGVFAHPYRGQFAARHLVDRRMRLAEIERLAAHLLIESRQSAGAIDPRFTLSTTISGFAQSSGKPRVFAARSFAR